MSSEYNELIAAELATVVDELIETLKQHDAYNAKGMGAMLMLTADMAMRAVGEDIGSDEAMACQACLDILGEHPKALIFLLSQLGKHLQMAHMGMFKEVK